MEIHVPADRRPHSLKRMSAAADNPGRRIDERPVQVEQENVAFSNWHAARLARGTRMSEMGSLFGTSRHGWRGARQGAAGVAADGPIDRRSRYREQLGEVADRIVAGFIHPMQLLLLAIRQLGLLTA